MFLFSWTEKGSFFAKTKWLIASYWCLHCAQMQLLLQAGLALCPCEVFAPAETTQVATINSFFFFSSFFHSHDVLFFDLLQLIFLHDSCLPIVCLDGKYIHQGHLSLFSFSYSSHLHCNSSQQVMFFWIVLLFPSFFLHQ